MTPSIPKSFANGSKNEEQCAKSDISPIDMFAIIHIIKPAGAATHTARPRTNSVLSNMERTMTFPICGLRYGGSSNVNEEGNPFNIVFDKNFDAAKVIATPRTITPVKSAAEIKVAPAPADAPTKNIDIIAIKVGKRPLQGTKLLVIMAIRRSRGESIIRHPITPAALHPNPMHMISC